METLTNIKILDANLTKTNVIQGEDLNRVLDITLDYIINSLYKSYGKHSLNSLIIYDQTTNVSVFTSDGIHKLKAMEFISPIQNYLADLIRHVGECIEKTARDGTTTGMLFSSEILKRSLEKLNTFEHQIHSSNVFGIEPSGIKPDHITKCYRNLFAKIFSLMLSECLKEMKNNVEKIQDISDREETLNKIIKFSSREYYPVIKESILEIFKNIPPSFYEYFAYEKSSIETDNPIWVEYPEWDYISDVIIKHGYQYFDKKLRTEFHEKECTLIVIDQILYDTDPFIFETFYPIIENVEKKIPLVIFYRYANDSFINKVIEKYKDKKIIFVQYINYVTEIMETGIELEGLKFAHKKSKHPNIIENVDIKIISGKLFLNNLFEYESGILNKEYYNKENELFQKWINDLENCMDELRNSHDKRNINELLKEYMKIYRKLLIPKYPFLKIGGSTIEHLEMIDVVEDTLGTISIIMKRGIIRDPLQKIIEIMRKLSIDPDFINNITDQEEIKDDVKINIVYKEYVNTFTEKSLVSEIISNISTIIEQVCKKLIDNIGLNNCEESIANSNTIFEMIVRTKDIVNRMIKCSMVIVPGTVSINKTE